MEQPLQDPTVTSTTGPVEEDDEEDLSEADMPVYILYCENCGRGFISKWLNPHCTVCQP